MWAGPWAGRERAGRSAQRGAGLWVWGEASGQAAPCTLFGAINVFSVGRVVIEVILRAASTSSVGCDSSVHTTEGGKPGHCGGRAGDR